MYIAHSTENWTGIRIGFIDIATANASEAICELPTLLELSRQIRKKKKWIDCFHIAMHMSIPIYTNISSLSFKFQILLRIMTYDIYI